MHYCDLNSQIRNKILEKSKLDLNCDTTYPSLHIYLAILEYLLLLTNLALDAFLTTFASSLMNYNRLQSQQYVFYPSFSAKVFPLLRSYLTSKKTRRNQSLKAYLIVLYSPIDFPKTFEEYGHFSVN